MDFYTNVNRFGSYILYRGVRKGERVREKIRFKPTLFLPAKDADAKCVWTALDGTKVAPQQFDSMKDAKEFVEMYEKIDSFKIYGNTRYVSQFIQEKFPDEILFDRSLINISTIDIEVISNDGFPKPEDALHAISTITIKNNIDNTFHVWGLKPFDEEQSLYAGRINYRHFSTEKDMLTNFVSWFANPKNSPDIITGWNIRLFDIPYIVNRLERVFGPDMTKRLSPWDSVEAREASIKGRKVKMFDILGISQLDYLDLFQKFTVNTYGQQETYKLGHIAYVVLGDAKLSYSEYGSLSALYENNFQKFVDYNIKDVDIVDRLEDKLGLITLVLTLAYMGGVNYSDTLGTTAIWDSIIFRDLARKYITIPQWKEQLKTTFAGGYVKDPKVGMHNWICSFDLNSLYPNLIIQYNMSPETILPVMSDHMSPDLVLDGKDVKPEISNAIMAANGAHFTPTKTGVIPRIISEIYDRRVLLKKQMIAEKKRLESMKKDGASAAEKLECERNISRLENQQMAVKILLNSLYGALGNKYFRYFDLRMAEGVTLSGQLAIRWAEKAVNRYLNDILKNPSDVDYVVAIDTDSVYVSMEDVVKRFNPKNPVKFLDEFCSKGIEGVFKTAYDDLSKKMNCPSNRMGMKREAIADRGIWTAKKRYILNVHNNEGIQYSKPKIKVMGIEAVKSSTPAVCRDALKRMFEVIMTKSESEAQAEISKFREEFDKLPAEDIAFPRSATDISGYSRVRDIYASGTPIHVRGCLLFNHLLKEKNLDSKYQMLKNGEKIKFIYLRMPNPIQENVISFTDILPPEFELDKYVDYDTQFQKTFLDPLEIIFDAIRWKLKDEASLESFFS